MKALLFTLLVASVLCDLSSPRPKETPKGKKVVYYNQADGRWGKKKWTIINDPKQTYQSSACGPSSMAMVVATLAKPEVTPVTMGDLALENDFRTKNSGTKREFFCFAAEKYGLDCKEYKDISAGLDVIQKDKDVNVLAVASVKKGFWTNGGHYIMIYDVDEKGNPWAHDPGHRSKHTQDRAQFIKECKALILISKRKTNGEAPAKTEEVASGSKSEQTKPGVFVVTGNKLNIRNSSSTSARVVGSLNKGDEVTVTETNNGYAKIGKDKWVSQEYLKAKEQDTASLDKIEKAEKVENLSAEESKVNEQPKTGKKVNDIESKFKTIPGLKFQQGAKGFHKTPRWIVVHYTGTANAGAKSSTQSLAKRTKAVSTHFFCDEKDVYRAVDEKHPAWHVGLGQPKTDYKKERMDLAIANHNAWKKEGEDFKGDLYSFGVDLCTVKANTKSNSVVDEDWDFKPETIVNGAKTVAYLCKKYNIPVSHVIRHADAVGKACPRPFTSLPTDKDPKKNDNRWAAFKALVEEYL